MCVSFIGSYILIEIYYIILFIYLFPRSFNLKSKLTCFKIYIYITTKNVALSPLYLTITYLFMTFHVIVSSFKYEATNC